MKFVYLYLVNVVIIASVGVYYGVELHAVGEENIFNVLSRYVLYAHIVTIVGVLFLWFVKTVSYGIHKREFAEIQVGIVMIGAVILPIFTIISASHESLIEFDQYMFFMSLAGLPIGAIIGYIITPEQ